jgi:FAD:protein FMN transferase
VVGRAGAADPAATEWSVWSTTARLVVTDPAALLPARALVEGQLAAVDEVASRFRADSEINNLDAGRPQRISPLLAELLEAALVAARNTDGDVDPTIGAALHKLGYDRDISLLTDRGGAAPLTIAPAPGWQRVHLDGCMLTVPPGIQLDLGATAKALTSDRCARLVSARLGTGVLVSLGGDIATAGPAPPGGWRVQVSDPADGPGGTIAVPAGIAVATSGTVGRQWRDGGRLLHHILDPRTCQPAAPVWRIATVAARRCVDANAMSTAALIRGRAAVAWLTRLAAPARLVAADRTVVTTPGWPAAPPPRVS